MNSANRASDTLKYLYRSVELLHQNSLSLVNLLSHDKYGTEVKDILDKLELQHNRVIDMTNEVIQAYEQRYGEVASEVDDLSAQLLGEING